MQKRGAAAGGADEWPHIISITQLGQPWYPLNGYYYHPTRITVNDTYGNFINAGAGDVACQNAYGPGWHSYHNRVTPPDARTLSIHFNTLEYYYFSVGYPSTGASDLDNYLYLLYQSYSSGNIGSGRGLTRWHGYDDPKNGWQWKEGQENLYMSSNFYPVRCRRAM